MYCPSVVQCNEMQGNVKDQINYSAPVPDVLSAEELIGSAGKKIEYFYRYKALYDWMDPYDCGDTGYYLIAYANDIEKLQAYCHAKGYNRQTNVCCSGRYEIVDIEQSLQHGRKCVVQSHTG